MFTVGAGAGEEVVEFARCRALARWWRRPRDLRDSKGEGSKFLSRYEELNVGWKWLLSLVKT